MSIWSMLLMLCGLLVGPENFNAATVRSRNNVNATIEYYNRLIAGDASKFSELNIFVTAMPKGGDLHHHYSGSLYAETYLDWVAKKNYCIYSEDKPALNIQKYRIETNTLNLSSEAKSICLSVAALYLNNAVYREVLKSWSNIDYANHYHEQPPPDRQFFDTFGYFNPAPDINFSEGLMWLKKTALNENVQYIETMLKSGPAFTLSSELTAAMNSLTSSSTDSEIERVLANFFDAAINNTSVNATISNYVNMIETSAAGINDANFTMRFQSYVTRSNQPSQVFSSLSSAFMATMRSNLIIGVNIVGPEHGIVSMRDYTLHMKMFRFLKRRYPNVKLAIHAGELVLGLVPPEGLQFHVTEAIEIAGASRIGHGIDIFYERNAYELLQTMKKQNIVVEVIISSNAFILGVKNDAHPMLLYKTHGVPLVIATDDAGVSRSSLSNEYLMYSDRYRPSYFEMKELVYNSIRFSFLSEAEKKTEIEKLDTRFQNFEEMIADVLDSVGKPNLISSSGSLQLFKSSITFFCCLMYLFLFN